MKWQAMWEAAEPLTVTRKIEAIDLRIGDEITLPITGERVRVTQVYVASRLEDTVSVEIEGIEEEG